MSWLAHDLGPRLVDLEVNPLIVRREGGGAVVVDGRATSKSGDEPIAFRAAVLIAGAFSCGAIAQAPQAKIVRIVNPFAAGGNTDLVTRALIERLAPVLKQQFIIENRPGRDDQYRVGVRDQVAARRRHAAHGRRVERDQHEPLREPALRHAAGFRARDPVLQGRERARRASVAAGAQPEGTDRARQSAAREAQLCLERARQLESHRRASSCG